MLKKLFEREVDIVTSLYENLLCGTPDNLELQKYDETIEIVKNFKENLKSNILILFILNY